MYILVAFHSIFKLQLKGYMYIRFMHKQKVTKLGSQKLHFPKSDEDQGSIVGHKIDYEGDGVLRGQRHIPSKN